MIVKQFASEFTLCFFGYQWSRPFENAPKGEMPFFHMFFPKLQIPNGLDRCFKYMEDL
jgi:hypothetical protein